MPNVTVTVKDSTFTDAAGNMRGHDEALVSIHNIGVVITLENSTFEVISKVDFLRLGSAADATTSVTIDGCKVIATSFVYKNVTDAELIVNDLVLYVTGVDDVIFDYAGTTIGKAIVVAGDATLMDGVELGEYAAQVMYAGEMYRAWIKVPATDAEFSATQAAGAAIELSSQFINTNPEKGGIRFLSTVSDDMAATLKATYPGASFVFGTVIAPAEYVVKAGAFTMAALDAIDVEGVKYVDIPAVDTFVDEDGDGIPESFSGALISLKSYTRAYAGLSYIKVTYMGQTEIFYGAYDSSVNARSAKQVADEIIADESSNYYTEAWSAEQKAIVDAYAGKIAE